MRYCIEEVVDDMQYRYGGTDYLMYLKHKMLSRLASKLMETVGMKEPVRDQETGHLIMRFDATVNEEYEIDRANRYALRKSFEDGIAAAKANLPWGFDEQYE